MYATLTDILERFDAAHNPELSQLTGGADGVRDDARIEAALLSASGEMDTYLGTRYALPLAGASAALSEELGRIACDIARYRLWADHASEEVRRRYDDAIRWLTRVAEGKLVLALTDPAPGATPAASASAAAPRMTRTNLGRVL